MVFQFFIVSLLLKINVLCQLLELQSGAFVIKVLEIMVIGDLQNSFFMNYYSSSSDCFIFVDGLAFLIHDLVDIFANNDLGTEADSRTAF